MLVDGFVISGSESVPGTVFVLFADTMRVSIVYGSVAACRAEAIAAQMIKRGNGW